MTASAPKINSDSNAKSNNTNSNLANTKAQLQSVPSPTHTPTDNNPSSWMNDVWGGLAAMLVALPSSVAFGILVYSGLGAAYSGRGAMAGLLGAVALGIVTPFIGRTPGLISAPCAPSAAVLSALVAEMTLNHGNTPMSTENLIILITLSTFLSALIQIFFGTIGGGKLIKFIPFQVVSGYLSGVGMLIILSQLPKLLGFAKGITLWQGLLSPELWKWQSLGVGIATMIMMIFAPRISKKIPAAIFGLTTGVITYFLFSLIDANLLNLTNNPLIIGSMQTSGSLFSSLTEHWSNFSQFNFEILKHALVPALTLAVLLSIDTLKTCVGLDAMIRNRHNSDRELIGQGLGNLFSAFVGGMPGAGTMGPTLVNVSSGGRSPRAGLMEGGFVLLALLFLGPLIAWIPIGALAGILLVVAYRMIDKNSVRLLKHPSGRFDFAVILGVVIVALSVDLIVASAVGVGLAILLFIRDQVRESVILQKVYLNHISSKTQRQESEKEILLKFGTQAVICKLQGNLFFGTTDQMFTKLDGDLKNCYYLLLDMNRVHSIDYTAIHMLEQMHGQISEKGGHLLFCGTPSSFKEQNQFEEYFSQMGFDLKQHGIQTFETLDSALEWMEEEILHKQGVEHQLSEHILQLKDFHLFRGFTAQELHHLESCMKPIQLKPGEKVFNQGDLGDEMFLVRRGSFRVLLPLSAGKYHHLATFEQGNFFGEIAFLDHDRRSADVEAKSNADLYVFSRARFNEFSRSEPEIGAQVFARIALAIAQRLRHTDSELKALEER